MIEISYEQHIGAALFLWYNLAMRIDKFLKNSRLIKRRTVAKEACDGGRVYINDRKAKAGSEVSEGDKIKIVFGSKEVTIRVKDVRDNVRKDDASDMYEVIN